MLRSPSLPLRDYDDLSSPDPLASSLYDENVHPAATLSSPLKRGPSSPVKSARSTHSSFSQNTSTAPDHPPSPSRTVTEQTLSPWKIRVTVEAEPAGMDGPRRTMTRTVQIPLRQDSSPIGPSQTNRRGRQSQPSTAKGKRGGTPIRARSGSRSRRQSLTDLDITVLGDDAETDDWTKQRSPRKRTNSKLRGKTPTINVTEQGDSVPLSKPSKRKSKATASFEIRQDSDVVEGQDDTPQTGSDSPELRRIDLNRVSVRSRSQSTKQKEVPEQQLDSGGAGPTSTRNSLTAPISSTRKVSDTSAMSYPTPSPTSSYHGSDEHEVLPNSTTYHEGFDTILESEGFTMIDLDSVPSARIFLSSPTDQPEVTQETKAPAMIEQTAMQVKPQDRETTPKFLRAKPSPIPSYLTLAEGESDISSNVPSSPPGGSDSMLKVPSQALKSITRKVTPEPYSSPKLPSPPKQVRKSPRSQADHLAPSKEIVDAGLALQDVISPHVLQRIELGHTERLRTSAALQDKLFEGFDSGTKRELRAGLRLGEELAKRQKSALVPAEIGESFPTKHEAPARIAQKPRHPRKEAQTQVWRDETGVQHTPIAFEAALQTKIDGGVVNHPEDLSGMSLSTGHRSTTEDLPKPVSSMLKTPRTSSSSREVEPALLKTQARREHEWQLEREAISREIDNASASQIIIIESDDDGENEEPANPASSELQREMVPRQEATAAQGCHELHIEENRIGTEKASRAGDAPGSSRTTNRQRVGDGETNNGQVRVIGLGLEGGGSSHPHDAEDSVADEEDNEDIWLAAARKTSRSPVSEQRRGLFTQTDQRKQQERAVEVINKPRRSLIPSPWKRGEDVADASTFLTNGDMSGILWQEPQERIKFGAGEVARQKRQLSGSFDVDRMAGTPKKPPAEDSSSPSRQVDEGEMPEQCYPADDLDHDQGSEDSEHSLAHEQAAEFEHQPNDDNAEPSFMTEDSYVSQASSPLPPTKIPVNFNDSTLSQRRTPVPMTGSSSTDDDEFSRLSTPRSALKGTRQSLGSENPQTHIAIRRVVFNDRSLYLNDDGVESSMSANFDSPEPEQGRPAWNEEKISITAEDEGPAAAAAVEDVAEPPETKSSGWLGWLWKGNDAEALSDPHPAVNEKFPTLDGSDNAGEGQWQRTKSSIPSSSATTKHTASSQSVPTTKPKSNPNLKSDIPSYLLPPSYPSDPTRSPSTLFSTAGDFTNAHFRTLHIIFAKSQRPRFHRPKHVRPELQALIGWKMEVDESRAGMDLFEWRIGRTEVQVLERFMQEVEFGWLSAGKEVKWAWVPEELAERLGRIVIGEVVREEERKKAKG